MWREINSKEFFRVAKLRTLSGVVHFKHQKAKENSISALEKFESWQRCKKECGAHANVMNFFRRLFFISFADA